MIYAIRMEIIPGIFERGERERERGMSVSIKRKGSEKRGRKVDFSNNKSFE